MNSTMWSGVPETEEETYDDEDTSVPTHEPIVTVFNHAVSVSGTGIANFDVEYDPPTALASRYR